MRNLTKKILINLLRGVRLSPVYFLLYKGRRLNNRNTLEELPLNWKELPIWFKLSGYQYCLAYLQFMFIHGENTFQPSQIAAVRKR